MPKLGLVGPSFGCVIWVELQHLLSFYAAKLVQALLVSKLAKIA